MKDESFDQEKAPNTHWATRILAVYGLADAPLRELTRDEERALFQAYKDNPTEALKEKITKQFIRLVVKRVYVYQAKIRAVQMDEEDIVLEVMLIMWQTVMVKYDLQKGNRFSTYFTPWIDKAINRVVENQGRVMRIPEHRLKAYRDYDKAVLKFEQENGFSPTDEEIAAALNIAPKKVHDIKLERRSLNVASLDQPYEGLSEGTTLADLVRVQEEQSSDSVWVKELQVAEDAIGNLSEQEAEVVKRRLGLQPHQPHSLAEIAAVLSLKREKICQIEQVAFRRMKRYVASLEVKFT